MEILSFIPGLEMWHVWLIASIVLLIVEFFTAGFGVACFAVGALLSVLPAACGLNLYWQVGAFALGSVLAFCFVRPFMLRYLDSKEAQRTNLDNFVGRTARVVEPVTANGGCVRLDGVDWSAKAQEADASFAEGDTVTIVARNGNILFVN